MYVKCNSMKIKEQCTVLDMWEILEKASKIQLEGILNLSYIPATFDLIEGIQLLNSRSWILEGPNLTKARSIYIHESIDCIYLLECMIWTSMPVQLAKISECKVTSDCGSEATEAQEFDLRDQPGKIIALDKSFGGQFPLFHHPRSSQIIGS